MDVSPLPKSVASAHVICYTIGLQIIKHEFKHLDTECNAQQPKDEQLTVVHDGGETGQTEVSQHLIRIQTSITQYGHIYIIG